MDSSAETPPKSVVKIKVSKNGPYLIYGEIPIRKLVIIADPMELQQNGSPAPGIRTRKSVPFAAVDSPRTSRSVTEHT